jgi:hypothetical protein
MKYLYIGILLVSFTFELYSFTPTYSKSEINLDNP